MQPFKLQAVLDHRQFVEDNLKKELADIRHQVELAEQHLKALQRKEVETGQRLKTEQAGGISSDQVIGYHAYLRSLADSIRRQQEALVTLQRREKAKQDEVLEAMRLLAARHSNQFVPYRFGVLRGRVFQGVGNKLRSALLISPLILYRLKMVKVGLCWIPHRGFTLWRNRIIWLGVNGSHGLFSN